MVVRIRGRSHWLWRAVDDEGEVLDFLVQPRRCARSARRLLRKLLKKQGYAPKRITTDKLKSYAVAIRKERLAAVHDQGLRANNRAENSHQPVPFNPRRRLQRLLRPTPSSIPSHLQGVSSRDVRCLEPRLACRLIRITIQSWQLQQLTCQCPSQPKIHNEYHYYCQRLSP